MPLYDNVQARHSGFSKSTYNDPVQTEVVAGGVWCYVRFSVRCMKFQHTSGKRVLAYITLKLLLSCLHELVSILQSVKLY